MFELQNRAYTDNDISEFAGKMLPAHPITRYTRFSSLWKKTRNAAGGYVPRPKHCMTSEDEFFPCCLSCAVTTSTKEDLKETLVRRSANVGWLLADWWWDFGWTLPEEFVSYGIGLTPPDPPARRDRIFVLNSELKRNYLDCDMAEHAIAGADQHEARFKVVFSASVNYPGEIIVETGSGGRIAIATLRTVPINKGISISERYVFLPAEMAFLLPVLGHGTNFVQEGDKILLNGVALN